MPTSPAPDDLRERVVETQRLADLNDADALFRLATWYLAGDNLRRDVPKAIGLLGRAADIGHVDAALMHIALLANGAAAPPDWPKALSMLRKASHNDPLAMKQFRLVDEMAVCPDGFPSRNYAAVTLSRRPHIEHFPTFLSQRECAHLADISVPLLRPSHVVDPQGGKLVRRPIRTSFDAIIGPTREDLVVGAINRRIAAVTETDFSQGEPLAITRYGIGDQYRAHLDTLPDNSNPRATTVIIYLNENFEGGETHFLAVDIRVRPLAGSALMFHNQSADGQPDAATLHAGLPVETGVKWIATRWIRQDPLDLWHRERLDRKAMDSRQTNVGWRQAIVSARNISE